MVVLCLCRRPTCKLSISCASAVAESEAGGWCQCSAFGPHGGLGCCPFWGGGSVVVGFLLAWESVIVVCLLYVTLCPF